MRRRKLAIRLIAAGHVLTGGATHAVGGVLVLDAGPPAQGRSGEGRMDVRLARAEALVHHSVAAVRPPPRIEYLSIGHCLPSRLP